MPERRANSVSSIAPDVAAIRREIDKFLNLRTSDGKQPCNAKCGVYVFYDYDGEPIYVGQTQEKLRVRIRRHLTNQRTDAVAMNVLDPFEVADIEVFPFYELESREKEESKDGYEQRIKQVLSAAEFTVFQRVLAKSTLGAVLNEKDIPSTSIIELPPSYRARIVPSEVFERLKHPDLRIARRASTIANLARVISERDVSVGLRRTLLTQARRLERLSGERYKSFSGNVPVEKVGEEWEEQERP